MARTTRPLTFRATAWEVVLIDQLAKQRGLARNELLRRIVLEYVEEQRASSSAAEQLTFNQRVEGSNPSGPTP